jgi:hypothetical protein
LKTSGVDRNYLYKVVIGEPGLSAAKPGFERTRALVLPRDEAGNGTGFSLICLPNELAAFGALGKFPKSPAEPTNVPLN